MNWKTPQKFKSIPRLLSMIDGSLLSSFLLCSVFVSRISESEPGQSGELNCFARGIYFELSFFGL